MPGLYVLAAGRGRAMHFSNLPIVSLSAIQSPLSFKSGAPEYPWCGSRETNCFCRGNYGRSVLMSTYRPFRLPPNTGHLIEVQKASELSGIKVKTFYNMKAKGGSGPKFITLPGRRTLYLEAKKFERWFNTNIERNRFRPMRYSNVS